MAGKVSTWWRRWREQQRQDKIERAINNQREGGRKGSDWSRLPPVIGRVGRIEESGPEAIG
jgi:hypothetical protein